MHLLLSVILMASALSEANAQVRYAGVKIKDRDNGRMSHCVDLELATAEDRTVANQLRKYQWRTGRSPEVLVLNHTWRAGVGFPRGEVLTILQSDKIPFVLVYLLSTTGIKFISQVMMIW